MKKLLIPLTCLFLLLPLHASALGIPKLQGYVNDYANMISGSSRAKLEEELKSFEQSDSTQLVILTLSSLEGETVEDYSIKVVEAWKLGQARKDNGILFLVSKNDRKMRIEVGRGLEGRLTDLMAGRIIDLVITPRFKRGDFDGGFAAGVDLAHRCHPGEFRAEEKDSRKGTPTLSSSWLFLFVILFLLFFFLSSARRRGKLAGRGHGGSPGGFVSSLPEEAAGETSETGGTFGGGGGGTFGGGGASGSW